MIRSQKSVSAFLLCMIAGGARGDDIPDAKAELAAGIAILKAHHMNSSKIDWPTVKGQAQTMLGQKTAAADAYPAIYYVIRQLGEKHTSLMTANVAKATMSDKSVANARPPDVITPEGYSLTGGIGLITLKRHQGSSADDIAYAKAARDALAEFSRAHICRYIVDLRANTGGNMYPMINGVEPLLGQEPYGYWQDANASERPWQSTSGQYQAIGEAAADRRQRDLQGTAPVAVLIDRDTTSAGEFTAMAFEGRARSRFFGEPTAGYLTTNVRYDLPDGAFLAVSVGWATDRLHRPYRTVIAPDESVSRGQATLDAAIAWLKKQRCGKVP